MKLYNLYILYTICISLLLYTLQIHATRDITDEKPLDFIDVSFSPPISNNWYYFRGLYNNTHTENGNFTYTIQYSQSQDLTPTKFEHFYCTIIDAVTRDILHELHQKPIYDNTTETKQPFFSLTSEDITDFPLQKSISHCIFQCIFIIPNTTITTTLSTIDSNGYNNYYNDINTQQDNFTYSIKFTLKTTPKIETEQPIIIVQHNSLYPLIPTLPTKSLTSTNILSLSKYPLDKHKPSWYIGHSLYYDADIIFPSKLSSVSLEFIHWDLLLDISDSTNPFKTNETILSAIGLHSHSMSSWFNPNILHSHHSFNCQINQLNITAHWYKVPTSIPTQNTTNSNNNDDDNTLPSTVYLMLLLPNHIMEVLPNSSQLTHLHITCGQHVPLSMYHTTIEPIYPDLYQPTFDITYFQSIEYNNTTQYKPLYTNRIPITIEQLETAPIALPFARQLNYIDSDFSTLIPLSTSIPAIPEIDGSNDYKSILYGRFYVDIRSTSLVSDIELNQIENEIYNENGYNNNDDNNDQYDVENNHSNNGDDNIDIFGLSNNNNINDDQKQDSFTLICPQIANITPKKTIYLTIGRLATINENPGFHARINWTKTPSTNTTLCLHESNICESEPFHIPLSLFNKDDIEQKFVITIMAQGLTFIPSFAGSLQCYLKYAHYSNNNDDDVTYTYLTQTTYEYGTTFDIMEKNNPIEIMALSTMKPAFRIITHGATIDRITISLLGLHAFVTSGWKPITIECLDSTPSYNTLSCSAENIIWSPTQVSFELRASDTTKRISQIECYIGTSLYSLTEYKTINEYPLPSPIDSIMATKYIIISTRTFQNNYFTSLLPILPIDTFPPTSYGRLNWSLRDDDTRKNPLKQFLSLVITSAVIGFIVIALILIALSFIKRKRDGKTYFMILREWCIDQIDDGCPLLFPCCHVRPEDKPLLYADEDDDYYNNTNSNYHSATDIQEIPTHSPSQ